MPFSWIRDGAVLFEAFEINLGVSSLRLEDAAARFSVANEKGRGIVILDRPSVRGLQEESEVDLYLLKSLSAAAFFERAGFSALLIFPWTGFSPLDGFNSDFLLQLKLRLFLAEEEIWQQMKRINTKCLLLCIEKATADLWSKHSFDESFLLRNFFMLLNV